MTRALASKARLFSELFAPHWNQILHETRCLDCARGSSAILRWSHFPSDLKGQALQQHSPETRRKILVNRLLYRSKQRGFLEMDLLVGLWAEKHVPLASEAMLSAFEEVLDHENPDLFKWLTGQTMAPSDLLGNPAYKALQESVGSQLRSTVQRAARSQPGAEWVRGWDDWKAEPPTGKPDPTP